MDFSRFTALQITDIEHEFKTSQKTGLSATQVTENQQKFGENVLAEKEHTVVSIFVRQFKSSFIYLLIFAAVLAFMLGEKVDGIFIVLFVLIDTFLGFYQEYHSEHSLRLLKKYVVSQVKVLRDGKYTKISSKDLVVGDIVKVETGDVLQADIRFVSVENLSIDESILSGESIAVAKKSEALEQPVTQIFEAVNLGFSGTHVVNGVAEGIVVAVGKNSQMGKIAHLAESTVHKSIFEKETTKISKLILKIVFVTLPLVFLANVLKGETTSTADLLLFSIALAVSVIPEALPVVTTFSLSKGALDLAKRKVIVKRLSAIEDLGGIQVLCTDKTGTITENKLEVADIYGGTPQKTLFYAAFSFDDSSFDTPIRQKLSTDELAILQNTKIIKELPFDPTRRRQSVLIKVDSRYEIVVRGAPEELLDYDTSLNLSTKQDMLNWLSQKGKEGKRVLGIGTAKLTSPNNYTENSEVQNLRILGLISFVDPVKASATGAIRDARHLGLQIKILTGDSKEVAGAVGYKIGLLVSPDKVITGKDLDAMTETDFKEACLNYHVFARISPEQKFKIIESLEKTYETGYLGDGINDAPALKESNVGIVVSDASDIARESSDVILLNKNLEVIVNGIKEGRIVFSNTTKYIKATLASNFGNFYAVAFSTLFIPYLPMLPIQLLLLNLLSDFPLISIAGDTVDPNELKYPSQLNIKEFTILCTLLGLVSTAIDLTFFFVFSRQGAAILQTSWFIGSVLTELVFIYSIRTKKVFFKAKAPQVLIIVLTVIAGLTAIFLPYTKFGFEVFRFETPVFGNLMLILALVGSYFVLTEVVKNLYYGLTGK